MKEEKLKKILNQHRLWLDSQGDGSRANLSDANLSDADLSGANLSDAYLSGANLGGADLSGANLSRANLSDANLSRADLSDAYLSGANLSGANLSGADLSHADLSHACLSGANLSGANLNGTILEKINWLAYIGIMPDKSGTAYAYKITNAEGEGIFKGGINYARCTSVEVDKLDTDTTVLCSYGINLATFEWCLRQFTNKSYRLFMFKFNVEDAICPIGSDGKFRVKQCVKVGECDWKGNLKKEE